MSSPAPLDEHDASGAAATLAAAASLLRERREVEAAELRVIAHWADLHSTDPADDREPDESAPPGGERLRRFGGDGTPAVRELATYELAIAREESVKATRSVLADTLDLRHRLPRTWAAVQRGELAVWVARKTAALSRVLDHDVCWVVDHAVAAATRQASGKVLALAEAKVIEADPAGHWARVEAERLRRYATVNRTDATGMRTLVARVEAGDGAAIDATIARVAEILDTQARAHAGDQSVPGEPLPTRDQLRAQALTWLARPAELLALLLTHATDTPAPDLPPEPQDVDAGDVETGDLETRNEEPDAGAGGAAGSSPGLLAFPADLLDALRGHDLTRLRPRAVLHVHLHEDALARPSLDLISGVARVEGLGPVALAHLAELLDDHDLTVQPVLDLADQVSTAAYEFPTRLRHRLRLIFDGDAFPHAATRPRDGSTRVDHDHIHPWRPPPDPGDTSPDDTRPPPPTPTSPHQTSVANGQPLTRGAHRAKTHLAYTCEPLAPGVVRWHTPHGLTRLVDHHGTHEEPPVEAHLRDLLTTHRAHLARGA